MLRTCMSTNLPLNTSSVSTGANDKEKQKKKIVLEKRRKERNQEKNKHKGYSKRLSRSLEF